MHLISDKKSISRIVDIVKCNEIYRQCYNSGRCRSVMIGHNGVLGCVFPERNHSLWKSSPFNQNYVLIIPVSQMDRSKAWSSSAVLYLRKCYKKILLCHSWCAGDQYIQRYSGDTQAQGITCC